MLYLLLAIACLILAAACAGSLGHITSQKELIRDLENTVRRLQNSDDYHARAMTEKEMKVAEFRDELERITEKYLTR